MESIPKVAISKFASKFVVQEIDTIKFFDAQAIEVL